MNKTIVYFVDERGRKPAWDFMVGLPPAEREKCFEYVAYLRELGELVRRPVGDYLGGKLYELRPKQTRIIYFFMLKDYAVILHAFRKKTDVIPEREIKIAYARMHDFVDRYQKGLIKL